MITKKKNAIKIIIPAAVILILVFLILWKLPFHRQIDTTITALMINGANTETTEIEIKIKGEYKYWLFGTRDIFEGSFIVGDIVITQEEYIARIELDNNDQISSAYHMYTKRVGSYYDMRTLGLVYFEKNFKNFVIMPYPKFVEDPSYMGTDVGSGTSWLPENTTAICYPAKTRDEAVKMVNSLFEGTYFNMK
jgi:hypothetical protein